MASGEEERDIERGGESGVASVKGKSQSWEERDGGEDDPGQGAGARRGTPDGVADRVEKGEMNRVEI